MFMKTNEILTSLYKRSGYSSYKDLAKGMGLANGSSVQRYFQEDGRKGKYLSSDIVERLCGALVGKGSPAITKAEIWQLAAPTGIMVEPFINDINRSLDSLWDLYKKSTPEVKSGLWKLMKDDFLSGPMDAPKKNKSLSYQRMKSP